MPLEEVGDTELRSDKVPHEQLSSLANISNLSKREQEAATHGHTWTIEEVITNIFQVGLGLRSSWFGKTRTDLLPMSRKSPGQQSTTARSYPGGFSASMRACTIR